jgi:peptidoglycan/LPS O-acetylase OafA/YrhL
MNTAKHRLDFIDSLRGMAALGVVIYHIALLPVPQLAVPGLFSKYILSGGTGITLFFVVSAFTMCLTMDGRVCGRQTTLDFYARRFFRIAPMFYVLFVISIIRDGVVYGVWHDLQTLWINMMFVFNLFPGQNAGIVWAGWTIGVEMLFYLLFPFIFNYVTDFARALCFFFITLLLSELFHSMVTILPLSPDIKTSYQTMSLFRHLPNFAIGLVTYYGFKHLRRGEKKSFYYPAVFLSGLYLYHTLLSGKLAFLFDSLYWQGFIFSLILIGSSAIKAGVLRATGILFIGKISYSFYLIHPVLIKILSPLYTLIYQFGSGNLVHFSLSVLITLIPLTIISWITYQYIEKPFILFIANRQRLKVNPNQRFNPVIPADT